MARPGPGGGGGRFCGGREERQASCGSLYPVFLETVVQGKCGKKFRDKTAKPGGRGYPLHACRPEN